MWLGLSEAGNASSSCPQLMTLDNDSRHTDDAGSVAGATEGTEG